MLARPAFDTIQTLRRTLQKIENDPGFDTEAIAELKRLVLHRIAELEAPKALEGRIAASPPEEALA